MSTHTPKVTEEPESSAKEISFSFQKENLYMCPRSQSLCAPTAGDYSLHRQGLRAVGTSAVTCDVSNSGRATIPATVIYTDGSHHPTRRSPGA